MTLKSISDKVELNVGVIGLQKVIEVKGLLPQLKKCALLTSHAKLFYLPMYPV
jgi:hypothetical protein